MKKIILKYDCDLFDDLSEYLLTLYGVNNAIIDKDVGVVCVWYDSDIISLYIINREILAFLMLDKIPSLVGFDKCIDIKLDKYELIIKDLCCEYCLKGNIEELLLIDGIIKVFTNFDYISKDNVRINLLYDNNLISKKEIIELDNKFNCK